MLILASASPRRRELLEKMGYCFETRPQDCDENLSARDPAEFVRCLALRKAESALAGCAPEDVVVAADTIVFLENTILGKPRDKAGAEEMLRLLSGRTHTVCTGFCVGSRQKGLSAECCRTEVTFYPLSEAEIERYAATGEPLDKAGAYGIQGRGAFLVKEIRGDFYNVMGLPLAVVCRRLEALGEFAAR